MVRARPGQPPDDTGLARARNNHGMMLHYVGRYGEALDSYEAARDLFHRLGDAVGEAGVLNNTSISWQHMGRPAEAIAVLQEGLALLDRAAGGGKAGAGAILQYRGMLTGNLGGMLRKTGRTDEAVAHLEEAVCLRRESGGVSATATALNDLASAYRSAGRLGEALDGHQEAIGLMRAVADRPAECIALNDLGFTQSVAGEPEAALESFQQAMMLAGTAGQPYERARALVGISRILSRHDARAGQEARQEAMATFTAIGAHFDDDLDGCG
jgi:tetratricopeptide (TPR) repeat protein